MLKYEVRAPSRTYSSVQTAVASSTREQSHNHAKQKTAKANHAQENIHQILDALIIVLYSLKNLIVSQFDINN